MGFFKKKLLLIALLLTTAFAKPSLDFQWADLMERFEEEKTDDDDIDSVVNGYHLARSAMCWI